MISYKDGMIFVSKALQGAMMKKIIYSAAACLALSSFAFAGGDIEPVVESVVEEVPVVSKGDFYIGGGISLLSFERMFDNSWIGEDPVWQKEEASWTGGTILAGYQFKPYLAVEGRYTMSFSDASWKVDGRDVGDYDDKLSNIAIYLKPMYPVGNLTLYGLLGYGKTTIDWDGPSKMSDSDFQWGIGAAMDINDRVSLFVDYTVMFDDDEFDPPSGPVMIISETRDYKVDAITLGVTYKF